jgi:nucleotide-binding universal stress UspA family protein
MSAHKIRLVHEEGHQRKFLAVIDDTPECESAIYFAACRASNTDSRVVLLFATEPEDFQHWLAIGDLHREEGEQKAKAVFRLYQRKLKNWGFEDLTVEEVTRYGNPSEEILNLIEDDQDIAFLVLGAAASQEGPGRLVSFFATKQAGDFPVPIVLIPGSLELEEIAALC